MLVHKTHQTSLYQNQFNPERGLGSVPATPSQVPLAPIDFLNPTVNSQSNVLYHKYNQSTLPL